MNTTKIAALYPYFLDALRQLHTGRSLDDMLTTVQQALLFKDTAATGSPNRWVMLRDHDNPVQRFDHLGLPSEDYLRELVSTRLFDWVYNQQPTRPTYSNDLAGWLAEYEAQKPTTGWQVTANEVTPTLTGVPGQLVPAHPEKRAGRYATWTGSEQELAELLRGLRAFRAKRRKYTRRLLAQLWAYHLQQQAPVATPTVAAPVVAAVCAPPTVGLLPRLYGKLRRGLATKAHQLAVAAEAVLGGGAQVA